MSNGIKIRERLLRLENCQEFGMVEELYVKWSSEKYVGEIESSRITKGFICYEIDLILQKMEKNSGRIKRLGMYLEFLLIVE